MNSPNRRVFVLQVCAAGAALAGARAQAKTAVPTLVESDPMAKAFRYHADSTKVDAKRFPRHAAGNNCTNCQLFQGKPTDAMGACSIFPDKQVVTTGWCTAWSKKAG